MGGCASAQDQEAEEFQPASLRKRLTQSDPEQLGTSAPQFHQGPSEADARSMLERLDRVTAIDLLKEHGDLLEGGGRRFSFASDAEPADKKMFQNKTIAMTGDPVDAATCGIGFTCRKGKKPEAPNQDSWFVLQCEGHFSIYAVFDGHGSKGHDVSNFVKENLPKLILQDERFGTDQMQQMLTECFRLTQALLSAATKMGRLNAQMSGTTATIAIHDQSQNRITVAWTGDTSAVVGRFVSKGAQRTSVMKPVAVTWDHKPDVDEERLRIEQGGGRVAFDGYAAHRVYTRDHEYPGLNMSRALGDILGQSDAGLSCEPSVSQHTLHPDDYVLLICSDGVWEFVSLSEALTIIRGYPPSKAMQAVEKLVKEAWDRWVTEEGGTVVDDITVLLVFLRPGEEMPKTKKSVTIFGTT